MPPHKRTPLIFLVLAGALILLLAMALPGLELFHGSPFSLGEAGATGGTHASLAGGELFMLLLRGVIALALILLPLYIIYSLFTPEGRKRLLLSILAFVLLFWAAEWFKQLPRPALAPQEAPQAEGVPLSAGEALPEISLADEPPSWLTASVILAAAVLLGGLVFGLLWYLQKHRLNPPEIRDDLNRHAQEALAALGRGEDFTNTIQRCYREMSRVVKLERGIARDAAMTAREFEVTLVAKGLPERAVVALTRLFEGVRYGPAAPDEQAEKQAVACLTEIAAACKPARGGA